MNKKPQAVISEEQFLAILSKSRKGRTLRALAKELGTNYQFLGQVFAGKVHPGPTIAKALGYEQVFGFRRLAPRKARKGGRKLAHSNQLSVGG